MTVLDPALDHPPGADRHAPGSIGAALSHRAFRRVFAGHFASSIGTWMQNATLIALAYEMRGTAWFIGVITFAQLGPMLFLSPIAGMVADMVDRKRLMIGIAVVQIGLSIALAAVAAQPSPTTSLLVGVVFLMGCFNALNAPAGSATLPALVGYRDLPGAIALNSAQMNASRVLGPVLGGIAALIGSASTVFLINGATYLFVVVALLTAEFDSRPPGRTGEGPVERLLGGVRAAQADRVVGRVLLTIAVFSTTSLVFIYQMPKLAAEMWGLRDLGYSLLFSSFGLGAVVGAIAMGTVARNRSRPHMVQGALALFAVTLTAFALSPWAWAAYVSAIGLGVTYFSLVTSLMTILQTRIAPEVRGRVMGLWMMCWAGLVPVGGLLAGPIIDRVGNVPVLLGGAVVAALLLPVANLHERTPADHTPAAT